MKTQIESTTSAAPSAGILNAQPYLCFDGRTDEALGHYGRILDAEVLSLIRFKDRPEACQHNPEMAEKVLHASFRVGCATLFASDCHCGSEPAFEGISLALTVSNDAEAEQRFESLAKAGRIRQPLIPTFFATRFGVVTDLFGVTWMILANPTES